MKYKNKVVTEIYEGLIRVKKSDIAFPAKVSYAIVRNLKMLAPIYEDIIDTRNKIIRDNSISIAGKEEYYKIPDNKRDFVNEELHSLGETENEISLVKIKMEDIEQFNLPVDNMEGLFPMIKDEE